MCLCSVVFYVLTIIGIFVLRAKKPDAERPYRALVILFFHCSTVARAIMVVLLLYQS